tara:strand:+ start:926 stop:1129 length:204 start_codon:yes stop_codon:yes gene_type:complete
MAAECHRNCDKWLVLMGLHSKQQHRQNKDQPADSLVDPCLTRHQAVVHSVVGKDEQAGVQKAADSEA